MAKDIKEQEKLVNIGKKAIEFGKQILPMISSPQINYEELMSMKSQLEAMQDSLESLPTKNYEELSEGLRTAATSLENILEEQFENDEELKNHFDSAFTGLMQCRVASGEILAKEHFESIDEQAHKITVEERKAEQAKKDREAEEAAEKAKIQEELDRQEKIRRETLERIEKRDREFDKNKPKPAKKRKEKEEVGAKPMSEEQMFAQQMGMKMSTTKQIDALFALADKFDSTGEHEKANQIDELLKRLAADLDLPEYRPESEPGTPSWIAKDKWDKMSEVHALSELFKKFIDEPTMDKHNALIDGVSKFMKHTEEEGVIASAETNIKKEAEGSLNPVFEKLAAIADRLDAAGAAEEASLIDEFIEKQAKGKEKEQDPYDTKQHHSEQVREPKKPGKETKDRDGRKEHHVETYKETGAVALSTRYCPEHVGVMLGRIGENTYQCALDGQVYNWETGWTDYDGNKHPGGSVAGQTPGASEYAIPHRIFDSREKI